VTFLGQGTADKVIADYMGQHPDGILVMGAYGPHRYAR